MFYDVLSLRDIKFPPRLLLILFVSLLHSYLERHSTTFREPVFNGCSAHIRPGESSYTPLVNCLKYPITIAKIKLFNCLVATFPFGT
ncbi:hypothetical protein BCR43DRAFT_260764 [Syncephalastrum racemosum]|uniref:Uncharacterized protein n=1 Tax=Syncephalastrum racemosum TaxID=13706 RepID=A0A1X2HGP4_SYNRA|nr:hypothetical protein BCR43DRAFT_260764 [Syncephalastrum racemosum]